MKPSQSDLRKIPGVGPNIEQDLLNLGYTSIASLKGENPEEMYRKDCLRKGFAEDRCQLYVYRLVVYYADHEQHDPEKLKWWYWKDPSPRRRTGKRKPSARERKPSAAISLSAAPELPGSSGEMRRPDGRISRKPPDKRVKTASGFRP